MTLNEYIERFEGYRREMDEEIRRLRARVAQLETRLESTTTPHIPQASPTQKVLEMGVALGAAVADAKATATHSSRSSQRLRVLVDNAGTPNDPEKE